MKTILFMPTATIDECVKHLEKTCYTKGEENYSRTLTESEIEREKGYYVENGARLKDVEAEAKASAESFNLKGCKQEAAKFMIHFTGLWIMKTGQCNFLTNTGN